MLFELYLIDLTTDKRKEFLEAHGAWEVDDPHFQQLGVVPS